MSPDKPADNPQQPATCQIAKAARRIARLGLKGALATRDSASGHPFISLAGAATAMDASPILLMSTLARHRRNLEHYPQLSLLFETPDERANPLTGARISVSGRAEILQDERDQQRFLARQPKAFYAGFSDFAFFRIEITDVHYVGGFGIAETLPPEEYLLDIGPVDELRDREGELIASLNEAHKPALHQLLHERHGAPRGAWRLTGIDPEGCDFIWKHRVLRHDFEKPARTADEAAAQLVGF